MLARLVVDEITPTARGVAADRETAVHIDPSSGEVEVFSIEDVDVYRAAAGDTFDLKTWTGMGGVSYSLSVKEGVLQSSRQEIY